MTNEILIPDNYQIITQAGSVEFVGYENIKASVLNLAEHVQTVEVTDENVKESKRLLAEVNKALSHINVARKDAKNELLAPYLTIEKQVKEIESILKTPTEIVRHQISELDERERDEKYDKLKEVFQKRIKNYNFADIITFESFVTSQHLNKSTSFKKVEEEMAQFLESIKSDMLVINTMEHSEAIMSEYIDTLELSQSITKVNARIEREEQMRLHREKMDKKKKVKPEPVERVVSFIIKGDKNIQLAEMLLEKANIEFDIQEF